MTSTSSTTPTSSTAPAPVLDALVIGAGPAGIGTGLALAAADGLSFAILDQGRIGQTFVDWPERQTFLTPSFTANGFGSIDLNAIHPDTSPAYTLGVDYPTGPQYAAYLRGVAGHFHLPVREHTEVTAVEATSAGFVASTSAGPVRAQNVIWAAGEFHRPRAARIAGSSLTDHSSLPAAWQPRSGPLVVIGGYESGMDVACFHAVHGAEVTVVDAVHPWDDTAGADPSFKLSPRTRRKLEVAADTGRLHFAAADATKVERAGDGYTVRLSDYQGLPSASRPIAATGFQPLLGPVERLFDLRDDGYPEVDDDDQSTRTPGLFLSGPTLRHGALKLCFIYKFRQRFAHVARIIGERAGKDTAGLSLWREEGMLSEDLSCCTVECAC